MPKTVGSGTTKDGNDPNLFSKITGEDLGLINRLISPRDSYFD